MRKQRFHVVAILVPLICTMLLQTSGMKISTVLKRNSEKSTDIGFQPSTDFARILSVSYKGGGANDSETQTQLEGGFTPVRKFDSGSSEEIPSSETPSVLRIFSRPNASISIVTSKFTNEQGSGDAVTERSKGARIQYGAASSHPYVHLYHHPEDGHRHTAGIIFPSEEHNEVTSPHAHYDYPTLHQDSPRIIHQHPQYYAVHTPKHVDEHAYHELVTSGVKHHSQDSGLAEVVGKSLKFWIPTALLLTGASVLFPNRVKVPTNPSDLQNFRPKRSAHHYSFSAGVGDVEARRFEKVLPVVLRREHRTQFSSDEGYDEISRGQTYETTEQPPALVSTGGRKPAKVPYVPRSPHRRQQKRPVQVGFHSLEPAASQYDAFAFQRDSSSSENPGSSEKSENSENLGSSEASTFATPQSTSDPLVTSRPIVTERRKGRKIRVLLRARKNDTSQNPESAPEQRPLATASKLKVDFSRQKSKPHGAARHTKETKAETEKVFVTTTFRTTKVPPTTAETLQTSAPSISTTSRKPVNAFTSDLSQREPELLQILSDSILSSTALPSLFATNFSLNKPLNQYDLSPNGPVLGLLSSVRVRKHESEACQKRALCELAIRGANPTATKFETFMWSLATLVPDAFTTFYDLEDTFAAIREKQCPRFICPNPNLDIQEKNTN